MVSMTNTETQTPQLHQQSKTRQISRETICHQRQAQVPAPRLSSESCRAMQKPGAVSFQALPHSFIFISFSFLCAKQSPELWSFLVWLLQFTYFLKMCQNQIGREERKHSGFLGGNL